MMNDGDATTDTKWYADSCTTHHICNILESFSTYEAKSSATFNVPGTTTVSSGMGTVVLYIHNQVTNKYNKLQLLNVHHIIQSKNLISLGRLNAINMHIDTVKSVLYSTETETAVYKVIKTPNYLTVLPCVSEIQFLKWREVNSINTATTRSGNAPHMPLRVSDQPPKPSLRVDPRAATPPLNTDYHIDLKLSEKIFATVNEQFGPFKTELFASESNHLLNNYYTKETDSFTKEWINSPFYGNPEFKNDIIYRTLEKAVEDFNISPERTSFLFVLPKWESAPWYKTFTPYFEIVHELPKGSEQVFSIPLRPGFKPEKTDLSPKGRAYLGPIKWPVVFLFKNVRTATGVPNTMLAHLRFGHLNLSKLKQICSSTQTGLELDKGVLHLNCNPCLITKARRIVLRFALQRPSLKPRETNTLNKANTTPLVCEPSGNSTLVPTRRGEDDDYGGKATEIPSTATKITSGVKLFAQLIFTDVCYMNIPSYDGKMYVVHFVDCASRHTKIHFLKTRDEVYESLKSYILWVKRQSHLTKLTQQNTKMSIIQSDKGGEYTSKEWDRICGENGIETKFTSAALHEDAAIAERVWETLQDSMRAMMYAAKFLKNEWPLAFGHAAWLGNRVPHPHLTNLMNPFEFVTGKKPDLRKVRVFGAVAYAYIDKPLRPNKLSDRSKPYLFVGVDEKNTGFLLYDRDNHKTIVSSMIRIVENINHLGKVLSTNDLTFAYNFVTKEQVPQPYLDTLKYPNTVVSIDGLDAYYDTQDLVTYLLIFCEEQDNSERFWIRAESLFQHPAHRESNQDILREYLDEHKQSAASYAPLLQTIWVKHQPDTEMNVFGELQIEGNVSNNLKPEHVYAKALILSDNTQDRKRQYGVIHDRGAFFERVAPRNVIWNRNDIPDNKSIQSVSDTNYHHIVNLGIFNSLFDDLDTNPSVNNVSGTINQKYQNYKEPLTYRQALQMDDAKSWIDASKVELHNFIDLKTFVSIKFCDIPKGANITGSKYVFKLKLLPNGEIEKHKVRLVAKGYSQKYGVDFHENFSPTPMIGGIRFVLVFIIQNQLMKLSGDVSAAFLNAPLKETVYLRLPEGVELGGSDIVELLKSLYGLKQAARDWYELSDSIIKSFDPQLIKSKTEPCLYFKITQECTFIVSVHVDDYIVGYSNSKYKDAFLAHFNKTCVITVKEKLDFILQMNIEWSPEGATLCQSRQTLKLVSKFQLEHTEKNYHTPMKAKLKLEPGDRDKLPDVPYRELVCSLLFIGRYTRPDILFAITMLCRFLTNYTTQHYKAATRVLVYLKNTLHIELTYTRNLKAKPLVLYIDSDWGGDMVDGRSTSDGIIYLYGTRPYLRPYPYKTEKQTDNTLSATVAHLGALRRASVHASSGDATRGIASYTS